MLERVLSGYCILFTLTGSVLAERAAAPSARVWHSEELRTEAKKIAPQLRRQRAALTSLGRWPGQSATLLIRDRDGQAEQHANVSDLFIVQEGQATLIVGGAMKGQHAGSKGELRAASIEGGERRTLGPGDIVNIPAGLPHQLLIPSGSRFVYVAVKVNRH